MNLAPDTFAGLVESEIQLFRQFLTGMEGLAVEIGCLDGFSTAHLLECSKLRFVVIDPFIPDSMAPNLIGSVHRFLHNVEPWQDRVDLRQDYSWNVVRTFEGWLDFIFIDGDHNYEAVLRDFTQWVPFLKKGGILGMHDSRMSRTHDPKRANFHPGPSQVALDEIYNQPERWELLGETWALTLARKRF